MPVPRAPRQARRASGAEWAPSGSVGTDAAVLFKQRLDPPAECRRLARQPLEPLNGGGQRPGPDGRVEPALSRRRSRSRGSTVTSAREHWP
jgi:hypothetical protein